MASGWDVTASLLARNITHIRHHGLKRHLLFKAVFIVFVERIAALRFNAFALTERGMLRRYTQGVAALCPGLIDVSLSGYNF